MYGNIDILTYSTGFKFKDNIPTLPNFGGFNFKMAMTLHCRRHHLDSFLKVLQESKCFANSLKKIIITKHKITTCSKAIFYYIYISTCLAAVFTHFGWPTQNIFAALQRETQNLTRHTSDKRPSIAANFQNAACNKMKPTYCHSLKRPRKKIRGPSCVDQVFLLYL